MIINKPGSKFVYEGNTYAVGDQIIGTDESEYEGLYGSIIEIRDGEDKDTENVTPDIYCTFEAPSLPSEVKRLERTFSDLFDAPRTIDDIGLDEVIMAPSMIRVLDGISDEPVMKIYKVTEDWTVDGENGVCEALFTSQDSARLYFHRKLSDEVYGGCVDLWRDKDGFTEEETTCQYSAFIEGEYCENHYSIRLCDSDLHLGAVQFREIGCTYNRNIKREHFAFASQQEEASEELTEEQYEQMLCDPDIPALIQSELDANEFYHEEYWRAVTNTVCALTKKYAQAQEASNHGM